MKKIVTLDEDMTKIMSFIKSIKIQEKSDEEIKGWIYSISIINSDGEEHSVTLGAAVHFDRTPYIIDDESNYNDFKQLYSSHNYDEVSPYN